MTWISEALERRFPNNTVAPEHFGELLAEYEASCLYQVSESVTRWGIPGTARI